MKALSILQPWAWLIVRGLKDIENRNWPTHYRGPFLVHAGKGFDKDFDWMMAEDLLQAPMPAPSFFDNLRGGIVGRAEITGCVTSSDSPWFFGPHGFTLANARPLPFLPYRGERGFFEVDYKEKN